ncbi:MAG: hypothetical protein RLZZ450_1120 [Pseudomonadota bacterium]|jgi:glycosyltransferase involved in cell wall biosynthesis
MRVVYFMRRPRPGQNHSVEHIVEGVVNALSPNIEAVRAVSRHLSVGVLPRIYNIVEAAFRQGDVNHVTGDVHFLTYLLHRQKTLLTVLDCGRIAGRPDYRKRIVKLFWFTIPVHRCAAITVISNAVKAELLEHVRVDPDKIHVVPVAVPTSYTRVDKPFDADRPVILQVGTAPNKNLPRLFAALAGVRCRLRIVGALPDEYRKLLEEAQLDYESFVGLSNSEMLRQYSECDIISFPSTFEGFGMPIIEGNIVGRPVVSGNVASMPEVASDAACLVDPFDIESIRAGFVKVIRDAPYREGLVQRGYSNAKRYDVVAITKQYESLYHQLAARGRSAAVLRRSTDGDRCGGEASTADDHGTPSSRGARFGVRRNAFARREVGR